MKDRIELLTKLGLSEEHAKDFLRILARETWDAAKGIIPEGMKRDINYSEYISDLV